MSEIFKREAVGAESKFDIVKMRLGTHIVSTPYQTAFEILAHILMAAKMASRDEGNSAKVWRDFVRTEVEDVTPIVARHARKSLEPWNLRRYNILFEGKLVIMCFNELTAKFHYADALELHAMTRRAASVAKAWAGDTSKIMKIGAYLSSAEDNYKFGHH